jgi:hypothetical protein
LREYVGRLLGGIPYHRLREQEFASCGIPLGELAARIADIQRVIPPIIGQLSDTQMQATFPGEPFGSPNSTQRFLIHLLGHLNYHLGQIDYRRRILDSGTAVEYAQLQ